MRQEIYRDESSPDEWELAHSSRCFVHLANSLVWREITGESPPTVPPTAREYTRAGLPWFEYYREGDSAVDATDTLKKLKGIATLAYEWDDYPLPENASVEPKNIIGLHAKVLKDQVREGAF